MHALFMHCRPSELDDGDHGRQQTAISEYTLLTDFMPAMGGPLQTTVEQVNALADSHCLRIQVRCMGRAAQPSCGCMVH